MTDTLAPALSFEVRLDAAFGDPSDPMHLLDERAAELLAEASIVWECDAATFVFSHVSRSAEDILGYPASRWTDEPTFWADVVLHDDDREESVTYCVAETQCDRDHDFGYRARAADGRIVHLRDYVRVIPATASTPKRLRGIMVMVE
ncbi:MAG TPA: PAS domain-containing protein [Longimicrobium sp.]|jgi:PAS domain-containing protein|uniref:PAS domain-containing protein n=1 Tax=Longimicrobium sp. TaxID=2029185 RepID=UPI002EDB1CAC